METFAFIVIFSIGFGAFIYGYTHLMRLLSRLTKIDLTDEFLFDLFNYCVVCFVGFILLDTLGG